MITLFLALSAATVDAQESATVVGTVSEAESGRALGGGTVLIRELGIEARVSERGWYVLKGVPPGVHELQMVHPRVAGSGQRRVRVLAGRTQIVDFDLPSVGGASERLWRRTEGRSSADLEAVDVDGTPTSTGASALSLLRARFPGVQHVAPGGQLDSPSSLRIRGMTSVTQGNAPVVYIDGIRIGYTGEALSALESLPASDVSRMRVLMGAAASVRYGSDASSGVVLIETRSGGSKGPPP